jgi:hypothetical protein
MDRQPLGQCRRASACGRRVSDSLARAAEERGDVGTCPVEVLDSP